MCIVPTEGVLAFPKPDSSPASIWLSKLGTKEPMSPLRTWLFIPAYFGAITGLVLSVRALWWKWHERRVKQLRERIFDEALRIGSVDWHATMSMFDRESPEELDEIGDLKGILRQMKKGREI